MDALISALWMVAYVCLWVLGAFAFVVFVAVLSGRVKTALFRLIDWANHE